MGAQKELEARYDRGEKRLIRRRTISIHLRFEMAVGLEFKQFVQSQGLTFSAIGNAIVKEFLTRRLREQQDALIEPVVRQEIRRSMGQQRRTAGLTYLQGRQNHHMLMSLLSRTKPQRAMDAQTFNAICDTTRDMARADVLAPTSPLDPLTKQELRDYLAPGHAAMDEVEGEGAP